MGETANKTFLAVPCDGCGKAFNETVARLSMINRIACRLCGHWINLESGNLAALINKAAQDCARADALLGKADESGKSV